MHLQYCRESGCDDGVIVNNEKRVELSGTAHTMSYKMKCKVCEG
jgi:hypothetical protein